MTDSTNHFWRKIGLILLPFVVAGVVAAISLKSDVRHLEAVVETKANRETVQAQYEAILWELQAIRQELLQRR